MDPAAMVADVLPEHYRLEREVGSGGMATVYEARDLRHDRRVAVKVLRPELYSSSSSGAARFLREIRIVAQLTHPHILPLIDSGGSGAVLFYVMPFIEGETLRARLARAGELPVPEALRILRHVLDALSYAHDRGVVHRDIKPENILLSDRHALVADFGVAKAIGDAAASTEATSMATAVGVTMGTPAYMAPEQIAGAATDHRADLYAAGVVAYEMLTGRLPFRAGDAPQMMAAHLASAPDPIARLRPALPQRLGDAVMRCLEKRPADRWQSAAELIAHIDAATAQFATPSAIQTSNQLVERQFALGERICRKLDRATLDPRIIGDHLTYVDNQMESDVLVLFLHGLGLDHRDFAPILERLPYRGLSPTLYGCEPNRRARVPLSLADHVVILREWARDAIERCEARTVILVGFSLGADMGFQVLSGPPDDPAPAIHGFLSLECNLSIDTCFVSRVLAGLSPDRPDLLLADLQRLGGAASSFDQWLNIHEYLVKVFRKFQGDVGPLQRAAADIVRPLGEAQGFEVFARWFRNARTRVPGLRVIFADDSNSREALARLKLDNLDTGILGEEVPQGIIRVEQNADHFDLMAPACVLRHVGELVAAARGPLPKAVTTPYDGI